MGLTVLDAGVVIGFLDGEDAHHEAAHEVLREIRERSDRLVLPASGYAEVLVGPSRKGPRAVSAVHGLIERLPIEIAPLDAGVAEAAAQLRARHRSLKLPDALVIATAASLSADRLVTTDHDWPSRSRLGIRCAIELL